MGDKLSVLRAIANVLRSGGRHAFFVLSFSDGLSQADLAEILDEGREHYDAGPGYRVLMEQAGFEEVQVGDATDTYLSTLEALGREWNIHAPAVRELVGEEEFNETTSRWQDTAEIVRRGLIKRYVVSGVKP